MGKQVQRRAGFTMVELIIVMGILMVIFALAAPRLSRFMTGRSVNEEGRRLISLTRYARSEAISQGQRVHLWIAPERGEYGIRPEDAARSKTPEARFRVADRLGLKLDTNETDEQGEIGIVYWPDGTLDETSPRRIQISEQDGPGLTLTLEENGQDYKVNDGAEAAPELIPPMPAPRKTHATLR
jgi:type II secretory pathway pseudopilin PulG